MTFDPGNRLIAALDVPTAADALAFAERLGDAASFVKVGLELFVAEGPSLVERLRERGARIMLDLKLHDIPATVARAADRAAALGVELMTVHTAGGEAMLRAAVDAAAGRCRILGVTVLTSMDDADLMAIGCTGDVGAMVDRRADLAIRAGIAGVVASPLEAERIRRAAPSSFLIVTPGVRPAGAALADQKRVMTPAAARRAGADLVVVGRPIRDAADPAATARAIVAEIDG
jgi:orotidine-5'-phosphate decarboxylase